MRRMSFSMTTAQMYARNKDVTRRFGWWFLKPGDRVMTVEKAMGLKKGEKPIALYPIEIISVRAEPLNAITQDDVTREGFPDWTPAEFIQMLVSHYKIDPTKIVNRIEFKRVEE
jgi:hypothetical protein